eukprot:GHVN01012504.1.p1 GENE.GHVN01012504.1~~GHVN01012504.1.p1  ORF type:complete len:567 (+),score=72.34 GHVN01012504.1:1589-3289(+)
MLKVKEEPSSNSQAATSSTDNKKRCHPPASHEACTDTKRAVKRAKREAGSETDTTRTNVIPSTPIHLRGSSVRGPSTPRRGNGSGGRKRKTKRAKAKPRGRGRGRGPSFEPGGNVSPVGSIQSLFAQQRAPPPNVTPTTWSTETEKPSSSTKWELDGLELTEEEMRWMESEGVPQMSDADPCQPNDMKRSEQSCISELSPECPLCFGSGVFSVRRPKSPPAHGEIGKAYATLDSFVRRPIDPQPVSPRTAHKSTLAHPLYFCPYCDPTGSITNVEELPSPINEMVPEPKYYMQESGDDEPLVAPVKATPVLRLKSELVSPTMQPNITPSPQVVKSDVSKAPAMIVASLISEGAAVDTAIEGARRYPNCLCEARLWNKNQLACQMETLQMNQMQAESEEQCRADRRKRELEQKNKLKAGDLRTLYEVDSPWISTLLGDIGASAPASEVPPCATSEAHNTEECESPSTVAVFTKNWLKEREHYREQMLSLVLLKRNSLKWYGHDTATKGYFKRLERRLSTSLARLTEAIDGNTEKKPQTYEVLSQWVGFQIQVRVGDRTNFILGRAGA